MLQDEVPAPSATHLCSTVILVLLCLRQSFFLHLAHITPSAVDGGCGVGCVCTSVPVPSVDPLYPRINKGSFRALYSLSLRSSDIRPGLCVVAPRGCRLLLSICGQIAWNSIGSAWVGRVFSKRVKKKLTVALTSSSHCSEDFRRRKLVRRNLASSSCCTRRNTPRGSENGHPLSPEYDHAR